MTSASVTRFHATDVGVFFSEGHEGQEVDDPYFGGAGPRRAGCIHCAPLLHRLPAQREETRRRRTTCTWPNRPAPRCTRSRRSRRCVPSTAVATRLRRCGRTARCAAARKPTAAEQVVFARRRALGTQKLLHRLKDNGTLPALSPRLGELTRSNSEEILGNRGQEAGDRLRPGPSRLRRQSHPEPNTHLEVCHLRQGPECAVYADRPDG